MSENYAKLNLQKSPAKKKLPLNPKSIDKVQNLLQNPKAPTQYPDSHPNPSILKPEKSIGDVFIG
jgi:hypothetical protein